VDTAGTEGNCPLDRLGEFEYCALHFWEHLVEFDGLDPDVGAAAKFQNQLGLDVPVRLVREEGSSVWLLASVQLFIEGLIGGL
jgi:hypothetical protein